MHDRKNLALEGILYICIGIIIVATQDVVQIVMGNVAEVIDTL